MLDAIYSIDTATLQSLFLYRNDVLVFFFNALSYFGNTTNMVLITCIAAIVFYRYGQKAGAAGLLVSVLSSILITQIIKYGVARTRPPALHAAVIESSYSFPSGHASAAAAFCGFIAYLAWTKMSRGSRRTLFLAVTLSYVFLMAFGRLYLGAHYLSDVLIGLTVGMAGAWIGTILFRRLRQRETVA